MQVTIGTASPYAKEIVTVANTVTSLTSSTYTANGAKEARALITNEAGEVRFWLDGSTPTANEGHILGVGDLTALENLDQIRGFRAIRTGANSGILSVSYLKR
jgi:hypothetical protein